MPGSSLRNAVHRRNHKERSQPVHRAKFGLLEKHKDYVLRAKDHHEKRDRLKRLREKAVMRNKDEFYFGMIRSKTDNGVHIQDRGNEALDNDVVSLLKTQDAGYIRAQLMAEKKRISALLSRIAPSLSTLRAEWLEEKEDRKSTLQKAGLLVSDNGKKKGKCVDDEKVRQGKIIGGLGKKTVWMDDVDQVRSYASVAAGSSSSLSSSVVAAAQVDNLSDDDYNQDEMELEEDDDDDEEQDFESDEETDQLGVTQSQKSADEKARNSDKKKGEKHLGFLVSQLKSRQERLEKLTQAADKLKLVRALMATKGGNARRIQPKQDSVTNAVISGKVTKNGLALPGYEDEDMDENESTKSIKMFKWSKERKR